MLNQTARILVIIGGLNWGLVGIGMFMNSNWNLVNLIFGFNNIVEAIVYVLVGISAIIMLMPRD